MKIISRLVTIVCVAILPAQGQSSSLADVGELYQGKEYRNAFSNPADDPSLPRVLLIGDSISIGYTVDVRKLLAGKANVHRIPVNGQNAAFGVERLPQWLGKGEWDVIHFNWGLWDLCYRHPESKAQGHRDKLRGTVMANPEEYRQALEQAVGILKQSGAVLIWCNTTPVPDGEEGRKSGDDLIYNGVAKQVMDRHGIRINDLHAHALKRLPEIQLKPGDVHFNPAGSAYLAEQVARSILEALPQVRNP